MMVNFIVRLSYEPFYLIWKLPSHAELAVCIVCGFISDLKTLLVVPHALLGICTVYMVSLLQSAYKPFANR